MALHVLIGENEAEAIFEDHARRARPIGWIVPRKAEPGDDAIFVFHRDQFVGTGVIDEEPEPDGEGVYRARVRDLALFNRRLPVEDVAPRIPDWKWPYSYSKGKTTTHGEIARRLGHIVAEHVEKFGLRSSKGPAIHAGRGRKIKASAPPKEVPSTEPKEGKLSGPQLDAVIREQTSGAQLGAEGRKFLRSHVLTERKSSNRKVILELRKRQGPLTCDACGVDLAQRYGPEHREVLELHHRVPLKWGAQIPKGSDAFALLCPTCHRVVHYRREDSLDVAVLRARLQT